MICGYVASTGRPNLYELPHESATSKAYRARILTTRHITITCVTTYEVLLSNLPKLGSLNEVLLHATTLEYLTPLLDVEGVIQTFLRAFKRRQIF